MRTKRDEGVASLAVAFRPDMSIDDQICSPEWPAPRYVAAFDHRGSLERSLAQLGAPSDAKSIAQLKLLIWEGIETVLPRFNDRGATGILIDRGYSHIVARAQAARVAVAVAIEASGQTTLRPDAELSVLHDELQGAGARFGKVLIRWSADAPAETHRQQIDMLRALDEVVADAGASLLLELLVPPTPGDRDARAGAVPATGPDPHVQLEAVQAILESGIAPEVWKVEGHADTEAAAAVAGIVGAARNDASLLLLGGGESISELGRVFSCRAASERFRGFAVGRSIWWGPVAALVRGDATADEIRRAVGDNYLAVVDAFESAAGAPSPAEAQQPAAAAGA